MIKVRLFLLGFLTLFLQLALIRLLAGNIWNLGYFPNLVLLAVFIGMGVGFTGHRLIDDKNSDFLFRCSALLLFLLLAFVIVLRPAVPGFEKMQGDIGGELYFNAGLVKNSWLDKGIFLVWFLMTVSVFALMSQYTAKIFRKLAPLTAYTLDIAGACAGILAFIAISWWRLPAYLWFIIAIPAFIFARQRPEKNWIGFCVALISLPILVEYQDSRLLAQPSYSKPFEVHWSPYQKVEYLNLPQRPQMIFVNGIMHQAMERLDDMRRQFYQSIYNVRTLEVGLGAYKNVLVIGSGSGNDVAMALANGAEHVDAVEIDPVIAELGKRHHEHSPYSDPRVTLTIDDGRAFMSRTQKKYDLIIFALTDSVVKVSPMSQLRLENYLFTENSVRRAFDLLHENGDLIFYNWYRQAWLVDKIEAMILHATQRHPQRLWNRANFYVIKLYKSDAPVDAAKIAASRISNDSVPSDDWPFLYLKERRIPLFYVYAIAVVLGMIFLWAFFMRRQEKRLRLANSTSVAYIKPAFFLMGMAFLLLETKSVIQFSLLFGTTWLNNSLVFLGILLLVLAANRLVARYTKMNMRLLFAGLILSALAPLVFPLAELLGVADLTQRFVLASLLTFTPIFFANLIFSQLFRQQKLPEQLFGWNLVGAALGGLLEYSSMVLGYSALALIIVALYAAALILLMQKKAVKARR